MDYLKHNVIHDELVDEKTAVIKVPVVVDGHLPSTAEQTDPHAFLRDRTKLGALSIRFRDIIKILESLQYLLEKKYGKADIRAKFLTI